MCPPQPRAAHDGYDTNWLDNLPAPAQAVEKFTGLAIGRPTVVELRYLARDEKLEIFYDDQLVDSKNRPPLEWPVSEFGRNGGSVRSLDLYLAAPAHIPAYAHLTRLSFGSGRLALPDYE